MNPVQDKTRRDEKTQTVDVVLPVYNEEKSLRKNALAVRDYLDKEVDLSWSIIIADNASTDRTSEIAKTLASEYSGVNYEYFPVKGRGNALRQIFTHSDADIVCYMDVDLSTRVSYLKALLEGVRSGYDVSIGSRLVPGAKVKRTVSRTVISRIYNILIKLLFLNGFSDAQCGFKAFRTDAVKRLLPRVENNNWFFDTEILLVAEYNKYKILEIPIEWVEGPGTTVHIMDTILEDLKGLLRLRRTIHKKRVS